MKVKSCEKDSEMFLFPVKGSLPGTVKKHFKGIYFLVCPLKQCCSCNLISNFNY